jgi:hypothetical protein
LISNPFLKQKQIIFNPSKAWKILFSGQFFAAPAGAALAEARSAEAETINSQKMLDFLKTARTHFEQNPDEDFDGFDDI